MMSFPNYLKKGLEVHFVTYYDEVFKIAFPKEKIYEPRLAPKKAHRARKA